MTSLVRSVRLPPDAASVGVVRRAVGEVLSEGRADEDTRDTAALLVSEVVTNAVLHAGTDILVRISVGPGVLVEVEDGSAELPRSRPHAPDSLGGRGLDLVEALAAQYGVAVRPDGTKSVWFTLGPARPPAPPGWVEDRPEVRAVGVLLGLPVGLYRVLHEYTEALFRDYELSRPLPRDAAAREAWTAAVRTRTGFAERTLEALAGLPDQAHHDTPILAVPADAQGFRAVVEAFAAAESTSGTPLTRAPVPELLALRAWILQEIVRQAAGEPPRPWVLPPAAVPPGAPVAVAGPLDWVSSRTEMIIGADEDNRIVAVSPAAAGLLGWEPADLVGRRLTAIIPESLREQHLAGFSRHRLSGQARIIGRTVDVPALRRDGGTVAVRLRLEAWNEASATWYLGWLEAPRSNV